jgi:apolipoprotein N-acyltransferase
MGRSADHEHAVNDRPDGPLIAIVQPNVHQAEKWRPENGRAATAKLLELSRGHGFDGLAAGSWPETAVPFIDSRHPGAGMLAPGRTPGGYLLTGAARGTTRDRGRCLEFAAGQDRAAQSSRPYDKVHLVPFGEYIPFTSNWRRAGLIRPRVFRGGARVLSPAGPAGLSRRDLLTR